MNYLKLILFAFLLIKSAEAFAEKENDIVILAKEALKQNQTSNDYFVRKEVEEKFADIKEFIQSDLKNGNKNARVDVYLLLDGLIQNNLSSLQSFLATNNNDVFAKEFSQSINFDYAEKLAYALKENKRALTTEYIITNFDGKDNCEYFVNGYKINNNHSFFAPAGLPYYMATYCKNNKYSVLKIQSENAQSKYNIKFTEFTQNTDKDNNLETKGLTQKPSQDIIKPVTSHNHSGSHNIPNGPFEYTPHSIRTAGGFNYFTGKTKNESVYNSLQTNGLIFYATVAYYFNDFFFSIDIAPILKDYSTIKSASIVNQDYTVSNYYNVIQTQDGVFIRPNFGMEKTVHQFENHTLFTLTSFANLAYYNTQGHNNSYSVFSPGAGISPNFIFPISSSSTLYISLYAGIDFPGSGVQFAVGPLIGFGFHF